MKEKNELCSHLKQIEKLLSDYEELCRNNIDRMRKIKTMELVIRNTLLSIIFFVFMLGFCTLCLAGFSDYLITVKSLVLIFLSLVAFIIIALFDYFQTETSKKFLSDEEMHIYKNNKNTFKLLNKLSFPKDYMCSGFANAVINEIKKGKSKNLEEIYAKCRYIEFDMNYDSSADYIKDNRDYINKVVLYTGLLK
ncbi:MAG: hypothetical protein PUD24_03095 [Oscillospiraceae bacterium]|nr:hypothetical protein [Oscillospiraceae bacterium]